MSRAGINNLPKTTTGHKLNAAYNSMVLVRDLADGDGEDADGVVADLHAAVIHYDVHNVLMSKDAHTELVSRLRTIAREALRAADMFEASPCAKD